MHHPIQTAHATVPHKVQQDIAGTASISNSSQLLQGKATKVGCAHQAQQLPAVTPPAPSNKPSCCCLVIPVVWVPLGAVITVPITL
jgi:hypothetical protein